MNLFWRWRQHITPKVGFHIRLRSVIIQEPIIYRIILYLYVIRVKYYKKLGNLYTWYLDSSEINRNLLNLQVLHILYNDKAIDWCLRNIVQFLAKARDLSLTHNIQTGSGTHTVSYSVCTKVSFPGVKRLGCEAGRSLPSSSKVKNEWVCTSTPPYILMVCTGIT